MFRPRIIPVLLLKDKGLVKSVRFKNYKYIGDPMNAVRIFNELKADELVFLDILASREKRTIDINLVKEIGEESNMPFAVGGGIRSIQSIRDLINAGAEKVVLNTIATENPEFVREAADTFGSSTVVVCMDVKKKFLGNSCVWSLGGTKSTKYDPVGFSILMEEKGAGEIIVQSIERDGRMLGYDIELVRSISEAVSIPVVALGGAGELNDLKVARNQGFASAVAAGSLFVFQGENRGVLINYPDTSKNIF